MNRRCTDLIGASLIFLISGMSAALAADEEAASSKDGRHLIDEIVVTATKRDLALQDVPFSVQAITGETLSRMGAVGFADYARTVPGLSLVELGASGPKLTLRGLSTSQFNESQDTVGVYVDEVPVVSAGGAAPAFISSYDLRLFDVERIEILRGPQGTLFGAGSMGGTIRVITKQPNPSAFESLLETDASSTEKGGFNYDVKVMGNVPLVNDKLAARAVVYYNDSDGFIDNRLRGIEDINEATTEGGRLALGFTPNEQLSIVAKAALQDREAGGWPSETIGAGDLVQDRAAPEDFTEDAAQYNLLINYEFGGAQLVSSSSYFDRQFHVAFDISDAFGALLPPGEFGQQNSRTDSEEFVQELRLASTSDSAFQWLIGLFYFNQDRVFTQHIPDISGFPSPLFDLRQTAEFEESAGFGEISYKFFDKLTGTLGARAYRDKIDFDSVATGFFTGGGLMSTGGGEDKGVTPKFNLSFKPVEHTQIYANVAKGYRRGGVNEVAPQALCGAELAALGFPNGSPETFDPDSLWSYEAGIRSRLLDDRFVFNIDGYYLDWEDLPVPVILNCGFVFNVNAGKAQTIGSELEVTLYPTDGLELTGTFAYTDAELREDAPTLGAEKGDRAPAVPRYSSSISAAFEFPISAETTGFVRADIQYVGSSYNLYNSSVAQKMDDYTLGNVRLGFRRKKWELALYVKNLSDERATLNHIEQQFGQLIIRNQPRTIGVTARVGVF